jgi:AraC-like DNA-binding protein
MGHITYRVSVNSYPIREEISVLFAGQAQTEPSHDVLPQVYDYYLVHMVISGKGIFRCLDKEYKLQAGDSFFIFPGELVSYTADSDDPWAYQWVGFRGTDADRLLGQAGIGVHRSTVRASNRSRAEALFKQVEYVLEEGDPGSNYAAGGFFRLLLAEYARINDAMTARSGAGSYTLESMERAARWLMVQYSQQISIEAMARQLGYHRTHLSKLFKQHTGLSPMNFLLNIRMERAKSLLLQPLTVEQVASSVGYRDALYFSKQFRKYFGMSPTQYRMVWFNGEKVPVKGESRIY